MKRLVFDNWLRCFALPPLRISAVLIGLTLPISTALDNVLLALVLLTVSFNARSIWRVVCINPVARAAWLLFGMLLLAMAYGDASWREALDVLGKYIDLFFIPIFMLLFMETRTRDWAQRAFIGAMGFTLLLSFMLGLKLIAVQPWMTEASSADNPVVFHSYITQNNMMAFAIFIALLKCRDVLTTKLRLAWGMFAGLAIVNVLFMVRGRTGYLILMALIAWFAWTTFARFQFQRGRTWGWRQGMLMLLAFAVIGVAAFFSSPRLHDRVSLVAAEYQAWKPNQEDQSSSTGTRLNFYYNAIQIVAKHPVLGVGTGGFEAAFTEQVKGTNLSTTPNPHNEFLLISAQLGLVGLALLGYLFFSLWRNAGHLDTPYGQDAARGLVLAYMVNCSFNSALHDHADGLFFAFMTAVLFAGLKVGKRG